MTGNRPQPPTPLRDALILHFTGLVDGILDQPEHVDMLDGILDGRATLLIGGRGFTVAPFDYPTVRALVLDKFERENDDTPPPGLYL